MYTGISPHANTNDPINIAKFVMKKALPCRPNEALEASGFFLERQNPISLSGLTICRHEFSYKSVRYAMW